MGEIDDGSLFLKLISGIVGKVNQDSVIVTITNNYSDLEFLFNKPVVAHKDYTIIKNYNKRIML